MLAPAAPSAPEVSASVAPVEAETTTAAETVAALSRSAGAGEDAHAQYRAWIAEARAKHPYADSQERMFKVMMCESRGNASIVNPAGPYTGLFQYSTATWNGAWNTYRTEGIKDARAQIFATALAWQRGMQRQWGCYSNPH